MSYAVAGGNRLQGVAALHGDQQALAQRESPRGTGIEPLTGIDPAVVCQEGVRRDAQRGSGVLDEVAVPQHAFLSHDWRAQSLLEKEQGLADDQQVVCLEWVDGGAALAGRDRAARRCW